MSLTQITRTQKKIIVVTVIGLVAFMIFWSFFYIPNKKNVTKLKIELEAIEKELKDIQMMAGQVSSLEETITLLKKRFSALDGKFPEKEEEALRKIYDFARQLKINVISLRPGIKEDVVDSNGRSIKVGQRICQSIFVVMDINGSYENLVKYIELLKQGLPAMITVEKLELSRPGAIRSEKLRIRLSFKLYLLS